jgi:hypothetical protein
LPNVCAREGLNSAHSTYDLQLLGRSKLHLTGIIAVHIVKRVFIRHPFFFALFNFSQSVFVFFNYLLFLVLVDLAQVNPEVSEKLRHTFMRCRVSLAYLVMEILPTAAIVFQYPGEEGVLSQVIKAPT